ncbi:MAG: tetratricopeptide repeat protein, partial [Anaerolineae bacterium]
AVAAALGVREQPHQPLPETIAGALQGHELLLLLDNCEHMLDGLAPLAALLLARCPELTLLATSRIPLHIAGEHLYDLPPMALPETDDEATVLAADAVQLFGQRAAAVRPGFELGENNATVVADLCRQLDGMPLAIELAAARVRVLALAELARHLDDRFRLLTGGDRAALPRQQTLRNTVAWSYDLLSAGERLLFDRLSIFAGSFDLEGAEEVCSGKGVAREEVLELVAALVDQSMIVRVEGPKASGRYRLLETLRAYGQERLGARGETEQVAARHTWYYVSLAEKLEPVLWEQEKGVIAASQRLDAEADNLLTAMRWSLAHGQPEAVLRIGGALTCWVSERISLVQLVEHVRRALRQTEGAAPLYRVKALDVTTQLAQWLGRAEEALATAQEELALARAIGDPKWVAAALLSMASATRLTGAHQAQRAYLQEGAALARQHGERALFVWASVDLALHEPPRQRQALLEELLPLAPSRLRAYVHVQLALAARALGDLDKAQAYAEESLAAYMEVGDTLMVAHALLTAADIVALRGDNVRAEALFGHVRDLSRRDGHHLMAIEATQALGRLAWQKGKLGQASSCFQEALELARQHSYVEHAALARLGLALVATERGEHERAEALCAEAQPDLPEWDDEVQALALSTWGRMALLHGDGARAVTLYRQALERARRSESRPDMVELIEYLAWALDAGGQVGEAARLLALAEHERVEMGMVLPPVDRPHHDRAVGDASAALGGEGFA